MIGLRESERYAAEVNKNTIRLISAFLVFAMLASVIALIAVAATTGSDDPPTQVQTQESTDTGQTSSAQGSDATAVEPNESTQAQLPEFGPSGLPVIPVADLPPEAITTLTLIDQDGPYPYDKDGSTFQNREGYLPDHDGGYYAEFTVDTPGLDHRGPLRIVTGSGGEIYWTSDHYDSFSEVLDWQSA